MSFLEDILRYIVVWIDKIIYPFIGVVYNLLLDIAETNVFTDEVIDVFASKVYALLGIFMLFKVSFSILTYIVNPDSFADKNKGFSKLISNVLITLALLLFTPWIFTQAMDIQRIILRDNIIGKIFSTSGNSTATISNSGQLMAYETFKAFYYLDVDNYPGCKGLDIGLDPTNASTCQSEAFNNSDEYSNHVDTLQFAENAKNVNIYLDFDLAVARDQSDKYTMSYLPVISSLAGIAIVLLLIVFCFDIAVRSIKLGFLRMIAPVPIISRIDPKKGTEVFNKWAKLCLNTYLDLFIRLIAIYFAVFVIGQLTELRIVDAVTGLEKDVSPFLFVFIVLGALLFAKQLPKLIEDLTGIKMDGKFTLNPLKKLGEVPLAGAAVGGVIGAASGMAGAAMVNKQLGNSPWKAIRGSLAGGARGAFGGFKGGMKYDGKGSLLRIGREAGQKSAQQTYKNAGTNFTGRMASSFQQSVGLDTEFDRMEKELKTYEQYAGFKKMLKDQADFDSRDLSQNAAIASIAGANTDIYNAASKGAKGLKQYYEDIQKSGTASKQEITAAREAWEKAQELTISSNDNAKIAAIKAQAARFVQDNQDILRGPEFTTDATASYEAINKGYIRAQDQSVIVKSGEKYQRAKANKEATTPKK